MKNRMFQTGKVLIGFIAIQMVMQPFAMSASTISSIQYDGNALRINGDSPFNFTQQNNTADNQIVLELQGVTLSDAASQPIDASATPGKIKNISAFAIDGQPEAARVVIQLNEPVSAQATLDGNALVLATSVDSPPPAPVAESNDFVDPALAADPLAAPAGPAPAAPVTSVEPDSLASFMESQASGQFTGSPITIQVRDAELVDVLRLISEASGFNIVIGEDVGGKISLALVDVPWDQALDVILQTKKLAAERNNNLLRIVSLSSLKAEKEAQFQAKRASEAAAPRVTQIFHINYADLGPLASILTQVGTGKLDGALGAAIGMEGGGGSGIPPAIQVDARTHTIIVQDTPENIERMKKLIAILDTQTPQVLIEAKIVEAAETFSRSMDGALGIQFGTGSGTPIFAHFNGSSTLDVATQNLLGSAPRGDQGMAFGLSPSFNILGGMRLTSFLAFTEAEGQSKTVLSPRITILNNTEGSITQSMPVTVRAPATAEGGGGWQNVDAKLNLSVIPHVTNDGGVRMTLKINADEPQRTGTGDYGVVAKTINTQVIVETGNTLVIGGIYKMSNKDESYGVPILRDIPIIGWLFGADASSTQRTELFIFITPRILNDKAAGLTS